MRRNATFNVSGSNYDELVKAVKAKYKALYGVDLDDIPHDAEFNIKEDSGVGPGEDSRWTAEVILRAIDKPRGSSGT